MRRVTAPVTLVVLVATLLSSVAPVFESVWAADAITTTASGAGPLPATMGEAIAQLKPADGIPNNVVWKVIGTYNPNGIHMCDADGQAVLHDPSPYNIYQDLNGPPKKDLCAYAYNSWETTFASTYHTTYKEVKVLDGEFLQFVQNVITLYDANKFTYGEDGGIDTGEFAKGLATTKKQFKEELIPQMAHVYGGIKLLSMLAGRSEVKETDISTVARWGGNGDSLDVTNSANLHEPFKLPTDLANDKDTLAGGRYVTTDDSKVYNSLSAFYRDLKILGDLILAMPDQPTEAQIKELRTQLVAAAAQVTSNGGTADRNQEGRCGTKSKRFTIITNMAEVLQVALCNMVVAFQNFSVSLLRSSLSALGVVAGIRGEKVEDDWITNLLINMAPNAVESRNLEQRLVQVIVKPDGTEQENAESVVRRAHGAMLGLVNLIMVIAFLIIAFSNILQIQVSNYSVNKLFAGLILGFVFAQLSLPSVRALLEVSSQISAAFMEQNITIQRGGRGGLSGATDELNVKGCANAGNELSTDCFAEVVGRVGYLDGDEHSSLSVGALPDPARIFQQAILNLFILAAAIFVFILVFLFLLRTAVFYFMIPLAPLAFFSSTVPPLRKLWDTWWKTMQAWLFMPVIATFWLWLAFLILRIVNVGDETGVFTYLMGYVFAIVCLFMAITAPFKFVGQAKWAFDRQQALGKGAVKFGGDLAYLYSPPRGREFVERFKTMKQGFEKRVEIKKKTGVDPMVAVKHAEKLDKITEQLTAAQVKLSELEKAGKRPGDVEYDAAKKLRDKFAQDLDKVYTDKRVLNAMRQIHRNMIRELWYSNWENSMQMFTNVSQMYGYEFNPVIQRLIGRQQWRQQRGDYTKTRGDRLKGAYIAGMQRLGRRIPRTPKPKTDTTPTTIAT